MSSRWDGHSDGQQAPKMTSLSIKRTESDNKLIYYIFRLNELNILDEEHGILKIEDIKKIVDNIFSKYNINFCYLFGSYAKNKATPKKWYRFINRYGSHRTWFFGLIEELRQSLHKKIDLLKINKLDNNQDLLKEILKDGIKIYG